MVFGRFHGDRRLDAQKADLRETLDTLAEVGRRIGDTATLRDHFAMVWDGVPEDILIALDKARELGGLLEERAAMAKRELPVFDDAAANLKRMAEELRQRWQVFLASLLARQTIAQGVSRAVPATRDPTTADCQSALLEIAGDLHKAMRTHHRELTALEPEMEHEEVWPGLFDLPAIARLADEAGSTLELYNRHFRYEGELKLPALAMLMEMIGILQTRVAKIEDTRVDLATHMAMTIAMRNLKQRA